VRQHVAIIYNEPCPSRYDSFGEQKAVLGVLDAAQEVNSALRELDYDVLCVPLAPPFEETKMRLKSLEVDLVFNLFEGFCGYPETEAEVADILTVLGIPYTGCPDLVLRLALDKVKVKTILKNDGIATPAFQLLDSKTISTFGLKYPCIVKPYGEDASHGISQESVVDDIAALEKQVLRVSKSYGGTALVEEFVDGREFNVTVLGNSELSVLPMSEIDYDLPYGAYRILTYAAKWEPDSANYKGTRAICPAQITSEEEKYIKEVALRVFCLLGCRGYARIDLRVGDSGCINVLEVNPNPDISPGSGAVRQVEAAGMSYAQFIERIISLALEKN